MASTRVKAVRASTEDENDEVVLTDVEAKELNTGDRKGLSTGTFAFPRLRKLPLNDAGHVRNAMARFNQTQGWTGNEKAAAKAKIIRYAKKYGIDVGDFGKVSAEAAPWILTVEAKSLELPDVTDHPNRMPFSGVLTKVGVASDAAPNGSDGKRVLLTRECVEGALDSLLGMGVDLAKDLKGHDTQSKIGVITNALIDGEDLKIEGFIYAADFPKEALKIHLKQADLGFSFEAMNLAVESMETDPLIVKSCVFTGAAILMKDAAAYHTTKLAASKAKEHEMDEIQKAVTDALTAALGPVADQIKALTASQTALAESVDKMKADGGTLLQANAAMCAMVDPHAKALEAAADHMEKAGMGLHPTHGHVVQARRMASSLRVDAAVGKMPHSWSDSGSYWASTEKKADVKVEETPEYKALQATLSTMKAEADKVKKDSDDAIASMNTKLADLKAAADKQNPKAERKTLSPAILGLLGKAGITAPGEDGGRIAIGTIDKALASMNGGLSTDEKLRFKTALAREGLIDNG